MDSQLLKGNYEMGSSILFKTKFSTGNYLILINFNIIAWF
jgi:hypothetical protein